MNYGFLIRNDRCIGCHACSTACKSENDVPLGVNRTWVKSVEKGRHPDVRRTFQVTRCNHCANPPCVTICPVTAMYQRDDGIVEFDPDRCIGCKACLQACPYDAIYIDPSSGTAAKCHYCAHRTDLGLEPACVVVCPEHAIIAGDMDDPSSEISRQLAAFDTTVRKPEQGTRPKLFYVDGDEAALSPTLTERVPDSYAWADVVPLHGRGVVGPTPGTPAAPESAEDAGRAAGPLDGEGARASGGSGPIAVGSGRMAGEMVRGVYNAQHRVPWHWPVPAYLVTKGMGAGLFLLLAVGHLSGLLDFRPRFYLTVGLLSLLFTGVTTALLVLDLERPERFLRILTRPQWRSWLTRGGYLLVAFSALLGGWCLAEIGALQGWWSGDAVAAARGWVLAVGAPMAAGVAAYTAFLFGQAEGRDLWQSTLLPVHLLVQAVLAGSATLLVLAPLVELPEPIAHAVGVSFLSALVIDLLVVLAGELGMSHASDHAARAAEMISRGAYSGWFWWGAVALGHVAPVGLVLTGQPWAGPAAGLLALLGLYAWEYVFVMAPQEIPNS